MRKEFGAKIKKIRNDKNLTATFVAKGIGVTSTSISEWEKGIKFPSQKNLEKISLFYQIPLGTLLDEKTITRQIDVEGLNDKQISALEEIIDAFKKVNTQ